MKLLILALTIIIACQSNASEKGYDNNSLHEWAERVVTKRFPKLSKSQTPYTACIEHSAFVKTDGRVYDETKLTGSWEGSKRQEVSLAITYGADVVNACAILMHGMEW